MADRRALAIFTRKLAVTMDSGLPLLQALPLAAEDPSDRAMRDAVAAVAADVRNGAAFAEALGRHSKTFPALYVDVVAAGEAGGHLDTLLSELATMLEKHQSIALKVKSTLAYPAFLLASTVLTAIITAPGLGAKLLLVMGVFSGLAVWRGLRDRSARSMSDAIPLWLPVFGPVYEKAALARLTRTLGSVVESGIPIVEALRIASRASGSRTIHRAVMQGRSQVMGGEPIGRALERTEVFPPMVISMVTTGEQTGNLGGMFTKIADYYDDDVGAAVKTAISVLQPATIVLLAGLVLALAVRAM